MEKPPDIAEFIRDIFARRGAENYMGEEVTLAEHMLQTAHFARQDGASDELITAALLHDIGHFGDEFRDDIFEKGGDNFHEKTGGDLLSRYFPPAVAEPIRLHVPAKRYLCATEPAYFSQLSAASVASLRAQGGPMNADEIAAFEKNPHHLAAVRLRKWDDAGKIKGLPTANLEFYLPLLRLVALAKSDD